MTITQSDEVDDAPPTAPQHHHGCENGEKAKSEDQDEILILAKRPTNPTRPTISIKYPQNGYKKPTTKAG